MQNETIHPLIFPDSRGRYNAASHLIALSVFGCSFVFIAVTMSRFVNPFDEGLSLSAQIGSCRGRYPIVIFMQSMARPSCMF